MGPCIVEGARWTPITHREKGYTRATQGGEHRAREGGGEGEIEGESEGESEGEREGESEGEREGGVGQKNKSEQELLSGRDSRNARCSIAETKKVGGTRK